MKISKIVSKPFLEVKKYKRFDFNKKVKKQRRILQPLIWGLSFPETRKRKLKIERINMDTLNEPYLMLNNHNSFYDFKVASKAIYPKRATYVVAIDGFIGRERLMREVGCFGKRKFINDLQVVKQIKRSIKELNHICMLYPEARYSHVGTNSIIPNSLGKLVKLLKVPVVTLITKGNHIAQPVWNLRKRNVNTEATLTQIITKDESITLSVEEINERINNAFTYDDYQWQLENKIIVSEKIRAEGLENVLYKCLKCEAEGQMFSKDNNLTCQKCNSNWEMNEYGELIKDHEHVHIPNWYEWQRSKVRKDIENNKYSFIHKVNISSLPSSKGFFDIGTGVLTHDINGFKVEGTDKNNYKYTIIQEANKNYSIHVEYNYFGRGNGISFSSLNDTYYFFSKEKSYLVTKLHFAVEEIYKINNN